MTETRIMTAWKRYIIPVMACVAALMWSCEDTMDYNVNRPDADVPEGSSRVHLTLSYDDFTPTMMGRSDGESIEEINTLWVLVYDAKTGEPVWSRKVYDDKEPVTDINAKPSANNDEVTLDLVLPNGQYRMYAVANTYLTGADVSTEEKLRKLKTGWLTVKNRDEEGKADGTVDHVSKNEEMFGWFVNGDRNTARDKKWSDGAATVTVSRDDTQLHAWLYRCASKVTLAYDGSALSEGVTICLMGASIKDIPDSCALGVANKSASADELIHDGEKIVYYQATGETPVDILSKTFMDSYHAKLDNKTAYFPRQEGSGTVDRDAWKAAAHGAKADALFFYENQQGESDLNKVNAQTVEDYHAKGIYGTYIEVEAVYRIENTYTVTNPDGATTTIEPESGIIKYRFMLGQNTTTDYNAERNYHYKVTMKFNGTARDVTWQIDFQPNVLEVTDPSEMDYRGKVFDPSDDIPNKGHEFVDENVITVTSFVKGKEDKLQGYTVTFEDEDGKPLKDRPDWLDYTTRAGEYPYQQDLVFKAKPIEAKDIEMTLNGGMGAGTSETTPYNLANPGQKVSPKSAKIVNTANCYVIDSPGWYLLPAVYGNGVKDDTANAPAYAPASMKNHAGQKITSPYIKGHKGKDGVAIQPVDAGLIWEDEETLIDFEIWGTGKVEYLDDAYEGRGGIRFQVVNAEKKCGNVVIGLMDETRSGGSNYLTRQGVIWSWHIWLTPFTTSIIRDKDRNITVTSTKNGDYDVMPLNLGWCPNPGDPPVKYYQGRECTVVIKSGDLTVKKPIVQKPHISVPCGNNTYYQWGRKDPFIGGYPGASAPNNSNKKSWLGINGSEAYGEIRSPEPISLKYGGDGSYGSNDMGIEAKNTGRKKTSDLIADGGLVKYPYMWHNPVCTKPGLNGNTWHSTNEVPTDLWGADDDDVKTVYDPCPVGYKVPNNKVFTAFTVGGIDRTEAKDYYYNVIDENKLDKAATYPNVCEFYVNKDKSQSMVFPVAGYRDWDDNAVILIYGDVGYVWTNKQHDGNKFGYKNWVYNFEFSENDTHVGAANTDYIRPLNPFYACDGFPVRPVVDK